MIDVTSRSYPPLSIGVDGELARQWPEHGRTKPTEFFKSPFVLTEGALSRLAFRMSSGSPLRATASTAKCASKHNNAVMVAQHVIRHDGTEIGLLAGPDGSDRAVRTATFVLEHSIALTHLAVASLIEDFAAPDA